MKIESVFNRLGKTFREKGIAQKVRARVCGVEMLVIGSGNYVDRTDNKLLTFINDLQPSTIKKAAVFATSGGPDLNVISILQQALEAKGYNVVSSFMCRGKFLFTNRGHPNKEDLKKAVTFARDLKKTI